MLSTDSIKHSLYVTVLLKIHFNNTLINTFFSKLCAFLVEQRRRKANDGKNEATYMVQYRRQQHDNDDDVATMMTRLHITCEKSGGLYLSEPGLMVGRWVGG